MKKNLVAMLLAVGVIATATGCGSTESTSTTSTTEYVTEEATTEEAQVEETTEYVTEEATEEVVEETAEVAEEITVDELTVKVREAMEAAPYVVSDYTVIVDTASTDGDYNSYYNKEANVVYNECDLNGTYWTDITTNTLYMLDTVNNSYGIINNKEYTDHTVARALNIDEIYRTAEADSAVYTLDNITDGVATVTINYVTEGNNATAVMTINAETGLIESKHYTETNESGEVLSETKLELSYPAEGTPKYDEFIQKTTIPAEAIEAANNQ